MLDRIIFPSLVVLLAGVVAITAPYAFLTLVLLSTCVASTAAGLALGWRAALCVFKKDSARLCRESLDSFTEMYADKVLSTVNTLERAKARSSTLGINADSLSDLQAELKTRQETTQHTRSRLTRFVREVHAYHRSWEVSESVEQRK